MPNKMYQDYSEFPAPDATQYNTWVYNPTTELHENFEQLKGDLADASPGDVLAVGDLTTKPKTLVVKATLPAEFSAQATEEGRIQVADGTKYIDALAQVCLIGTAAPGVLDGWEGAMWYDTTAKLLYGPKGFTAAGQWGAGRSPVPPTEYLSAEIDTATVPLDPARLILRLTDIDESGGFTEDANGVAVPVTGTYRVTYQWQATNNSGTEAVFHGELLVNGSAPATRDRKIEARFETSRWPHLGFTVRLDLTAGDVIAVNTWAFAGTFGINGNAGGVLIERVA